MEGEVLLKKKRQEQQEEKQKTMKRQKKAEGQRIEGRRRWQQGGEQRLEVEAEDLFDQQKKERRMSES